jgi:hypothetical protein
MAACIYAPLLRRVKFWQLTTFGFSGWCALYSAALLNWGNWRNLVGHAQGGCFAVTMTLAGVTARRHQRDAANSADPFQWAATISTEQINALLARTMTKREFYVETCQPAEIQRGFGVRAINSGRKMVFETSHWQEQVVNLEHVQTAETNRLAVQAELAVIVGVGIADEAAQNFVRTHPLRLLLGHELQALVDAERTEAEQSASKSAGGQMWPKRAATTRFSRCWNWWPAFTRRRGASAIDDKN